MEAKYYKDILWNNIDFKLLRTKFNAKWQSFDKEQINRKKITEIDFAHILETQCHTLLFTALYELMNDIFIAKLKKIVTHNLFLSTGSIIDKYEDKVFIINHESRTSLERTIKRIAKHINKFLLDQIIDDVFYLHEIKTSRHPRRLTEMDISFKQMDRVIELNKLGESFNKACLKTMQENKLNLSNFESFKTNIRQLLKRRNIKIIKGKPGRPKK